MEIVSTAVYVGPNVYAKPPLIRLTVDLHRRADDAGVALWREAAGAALRAASRAWRPPPARRACRCPSGWRRADCRLGELMAQVAIALQNRAGAPAEVALTRPAHHPDEVEVLLRLRVRGDRARSRRGGAERDPRADRAAGRRATSTWPRRSPTSTISPAGARSGPRRWRWCAPPRPGTSRGSG